MVCEMQRLKMRSSIFIETKRGAQDKGSAPVQQTTAQAQHVKAHVGRVAQHVVGNCSATMLKTGRKESLSHASRS
jgi:hypothetical protein